MLLSLTKLKAKGLATDLHLYGTKVKARKLRLLLAIMLK